MPRTGPPLPPLPLLALVAVALAAATAADGCRSGKGAGAPAAGGAGAGTSAPAPAPGANAVRSRLPRIDVHMHIGPDAVDRAVALMDRWGIDGAVNLSGMYPGPPYE